MPEALLIAAPLAVLAVVIVLGFAGCTFKKGIPPAPGPTLTFRARVPATLSVTSGVTFAWTRPTSVAGTQTVTWPTSDGTNNVYEHQVPNPEPGAWLGRCEMAVQEGGQSADAASANEPFDLPGAVQDNVVLFETQGSPASPPFRVLFRGLNPP